MYYNNVTEKLRDVVPSEADCEKLCKYDVRPSRQPVITGNSGFLPFLVTIYLEWERERERERDLHNV